MRVLVPNLGSASFTYQVIEYPSESVVGKGRRERVTDYEKAVADLPLSQDGVDAVAFKAVHGGPRFRGTHLIDAAVVDALDRFSTAAPAQNLLCLAAVRAFQATAPRLPLVAAFETEFHRTIPEQASRYGINSAWSGSDEVRRYGFHGASHQYVSETTPHLLRRSSSGLRLVSCHLGVTSSLCAIVHGRSVDVTAGFSPQSGIEGSTRPGELDPFGVLHLMEQNGWDIPETRRRLVQEAGVAGVSGIASGDVRDLEQAAYAGNASAELALSLLCYEVKKGIGAFAAVMGGLDAVAFTGGFGEGSAAIRMRCCQGLEFLGVQLDPERNEVGAADRTISAEGAATQVVVLATNEDLMVGRRAYASLQARMSVRRRAT